MIEQDKQTAVRNSNINAFVSTVSHDLRSPLSIIHLSSSLILQEIQKDTRGEIIRQKVEIIQRQVASMFRMINTLLDAEKITIGKLPITKNEVDAVEDILEVLDEFIPFATSRGLLLDAKVPERPLQAFYDKDRIRQVLGNLVSNAMKFSQEGSVCTLSVKRDENPNWIRFEVSNVGKVIPESKRQLIFERYEQIDPASTEYHTVSSGLGLWISKWIIVEHGGRIWVDPLEGGNVFRFVLPYE